MSAFCGESHALLRAGGYAAGKFASSLRLNPARKSNQYSTHHLLRRAGPIPEQPPAPGGPIRNGYTATVMTTMVGLPALPSIRVLGFAVHDLPMDSALDAIDAFIVEGSPHIVVTADSSMLVMAQADEELAAILRKAALVTVDSAGVLWAARRNGAALRSRVSGVELVEQLCKRSAHSGLRIYFLGSAPGIAQGAAAEMERRYPGAVIAGTHHGYYAPEEEKSVCDAVVQAKPDVLCVAMGIPRQEKWINRHQQEIGVPVAIGVGGTLDVLSGSVRRAPRPIQAAKMEWLWRTLANPKKARKAALLPRFVLLNLLRRRDGC